jgi:hypothetical protein
LWTLHGLLRTAGAVEANGLFNSRAEKAIAADDVENRPIDADSRSNRAVSDSRKFLFDNNSADY